MIFGCSNFVACNLDNGAFSGVFRQKRAGGALGKKLLPLTIRIIIVRAKVHEESNIHDRAERERQRKEGAHLRYAPQSYWYYTHSKSVYISSLSRYMGIEHTSRARPACGPRGRYAGAPYGRCRSYRPATNALRYAPCFLVAGLSVRGGKAYSTSPSDTSTSRHPHLLYALSPRSRSLARATRRFRRTPTLATPKLSAIAGACAIFRGCPAQCAGAGPKTPQNGPKRKTRLSSLYEHPISPLRHPPSCSTTAMWPRGRSQACSLGHAGRIKALAR